MVCSKCNKEIDANAKFCRGCGAAVEDMEIQNQNGSGNSLSEYAMNETDNKQEIDKNCGSDETEQNIEKKGYTKGLGWSPVVISCTALLTAALVVSIVYFGVISGKKYEAVSFNLGSYETSASQEVQNTQDNTQVNTTDSENQGNEETLERSQ